MNDDPQIACSLSAGDYAERLGEIKRVGVEGFLGFDERPDGADIRFRSTPEIGDRLGSIVRAESECCSFLTLSLAPRGSALVLSITAPADAMPVVRQLTNSFAIAQEDI